MRRILNRIRRNAEVPNYNGVGIVHVLNVWALPDGPCVWQKNARTTITDGPAPIIMGVHRRGDRAYIELLVRFDSDHLPLRSQSVPFLGLDAADLERTLREHGATRVDIFGGYQDQPYDRQTSTDLILVAEK